ncbi:MAG TPA: stage II sporulation protein M [Thermoanaerobaculia bacterium]|nr:stage II sporulation protein M [Thermoanaerobaculia bacterium]
MIPSATPLAGLGDPFAVERFVRERSGRWRRLEELLDLADRTSEAALGPELIRELVRLYRLAAADLSAARSLTADPDLLGRLNALYSRGYRFVYSAPGFRRRGRLADPLRRFFAVDLPAAYQREARAVAAAAAALLLGTLLGLGAVLAHPAASVDLIPGEFYTASPRDRVAQIEHGEERIATVEQAAGFGAFLYTHNIQVSFLAFSLGALTLVLGLLFLFWTGLFLGAIAATYYLDGVSVFFLAWVGPHGALEIPSIVFSGAAGLVLGRALLLPGDRSRGAALRAAFPTIWRMMAGVMLFLVAAGLIEGSFSQLSAKAVPYPLKIGVAAVLLLSLFVYLFFRRVGRGAGGPG